MKTTVHGEENEIILQTVKLAKNPQDRTAVYLFRCYHDGTAIARIQGEVQSIHAGLTPTEDVTVIEQCHTCKENYTFQTTRVFKPEIKLTLSIHNDKNGMQTEFMCPICRTPLIDYTPKSIMLLPWNTKAVLPQKFTCFNPTCNRKYLLQEVVSLVI